MIPLLLAFALAHDPLIAPGQLFSPPAGPVYIGLSLPSETDAEISAALLEADGTLIAETGRLAPGTFNLLDEAPAIASLSHAAYLQLMVNGEPVGSSLVVQPLINRPLVRTTTAFRPDGVTKYTRIIGWGETLLEPDNAEYQKLQPTWPKGDPTPLSGFRIYTEQDAIVMTDRGEIRVAFRPDEAPNTVWNFMTLVENHFFDNTVFHRVVPVDRNGNPFVIQGGDPTATGDGGPGWDLPLEPSRLPHDFGVISMARADPPDSAGSQFFFALSREGTARLDGQYCAFGCAVVGTDAILAIAASPLADPATGAPKDPPRIIKASLTPAPPRTPGRGRPDTCITRPPPPPPPDPNNVPR